MFLSRNNLQYSYHENTAGAIVMSEKFGANFTTDNVINQYKSFKTIHSNIVGCLSISDAQRDAVQNNHIRYYLHFMN